MRNFHFQWQYWLEQLEIRSRGSIMAQSIHVENHSSLEECEKEIVSLIFNPDLEYANLLQCIAFPTVRCSGKFYKFTSKMLNLFNSFKLKKDAINSI